MGLPNVHIDLQNGALGGSQATSDGVVGLILTGAAVPEKLELNKHYILTSTRDLVVRGIEAKTNPLADKEVKAFFAQAGEGAELHLIVVSEATTLTEMVAPLDTSALSKLIVAGGGRIKVVGINKIAPVGYVPNVTKGIDGDAITAALDAQKSADSYTTKIMPFRVLIPCPLFDAESDSLYKPAEASFNRVAMVLASDDKETRTAAIGQILGRAAKIEPQQSLARVASGAIDVEGYFTNGKTSIELAGMGNLLHDAGYIFYRHYPTKNGVYLNDDRMAVALSDDYAYLNNGRIIDKVMSIVYNTYIGDIQDNILIDNDGKLPQAACMDFQSQVETAVASQTQGQISNFSAFVDPNQNILSTGRLDVVCSVTPLGTLKNIEVSLGFVNPSK